MVRVLRNPTEIGFKNMITRVSQSCMPIIRTRFSIIAFFGGIIYGKAN